MTDQLEFMTTKEVMHFLGISRPTLYRMERDGRLPHSVKSGVWLKSSIDKAVRGWALMSERHLISNKFNFKKAA